MTRMWRVLRGDYEVLQVINYGSHVIRAVYMFLRIHPERLENGLSSIQ